MKTLIIILSLFLTLPISADSDDVYQINQRELQCLAANIYYESRGEPIKGQVAVAYVTLNRVNDPRFPKTICGVVKQPKQFSWVTPDKKKSIFKKDLPYETVALAIEVMLGSHPDYSKGALFFHNTTVGPFKRKRTTKIGNHIFYA